MKAQSLKAMTTEDKILDAAFDVVRDYSIDGTRIHLVAERAGLFQSNIHYYFKSKRDLLFAVLERLHTHCEEIRAVSRTQARDTLESQIEVFFEQKKQFIRNEPKYDFAEIDFWTQARLDEDIRQKFVKSFNKWREEIGRVFARYAPWVPRKQREYLCALMVSMMEGASFQILIDEKAFDLDEYFENCKRLMLTQIEQYRV